MTAWSRCRLRYAGCLLLCGLALATAAPAQSISCPLAAQKPMLLFQLFFGRSVPDRGPVTAREWSTFLRQNVTPRFPDGFTVYDAYGQWLNPASHAIARESTKVIVIATVDTPDVRTKITAVSESYRRLFHQQSVGIVSSAACAAF